MSTRRTFNPSQRRKLFDQANGQCRECGQPLPARWHADHVVPFSRGGETVITNGRALCPPCNTRKGATIVSDADLHLWQSDALAEFLQYCDGNADVTYAYQRALSAGVVRPILFYGQIGEVDWIDHDGERQTHSTSVEIADDRVAAQRYNLATRCGSRIARDMCLSAIAHLTELRRDDHDAGMIVFAADQDQAVQWRNWFQTKTKDNVSLVTSNTSDNRRRLDEFINGTTSIIVCVDMIGKRVDIPRLRVAVYLGRVRDSDSTLWQYLGRILRVPDDEKGLAWEAKWYMVQDPTLRVWAMKVREAVNAVARERESQPQNGTGSAETRCPLVALHTQATDDVYQIHEQLHVTQAEWAAIERHARDLEPTIRQPWWAIAKNLLAMKGIVVPTSMPSPESTQIYVEEKEAKQRVVDLVRRYGGLLTDMHHVSRYSFVWDELKRIDGRRHADCTTQHHLRRIEILTTWIAAGGQYHDR